MSARTRGSTHSITRGSTHAPPHDSKQCRQEHPLWHAPHQPQHSAQRQLFIQKSKDTVSGIASKEAKEEPLGAMGVADHDIKDHRIHEAIERPVGEATGEDTGGATTTRVVVAQFGVEHFGVKHFGVKQLGVEHFGVKHFRNALGVVLYTQKCKPRRSFDSPPLRSDSQYPLSEAARKAVRGHRYNALLIFQHPICGTP